MVWMLWTSPVRPAAKLSVSRSLEVVGVVGVVTELVQMGLHPQVETSKSSKQAAAAANPAKPDKMKIDPETCVCPGPDSWCIVTG